MREPEPLADELERLLAEGFRAFKLGWGPFGRVSAAMDEAIVARAREAVGPDVALMVDAGGSDAFWPNGYTWALRTADMLAEHGVGWFEEPLSPDALDDFRLLREHSRVPIAGGEVLTRRQSFVPWLQGHAFDIVQPDVDQGRRDQRGAADRLDGARQRRRVRAARLEHRARARRGPPARVGASRARSSSST